LKTRGWRWPTGAGSGSNRLSALVDEGGADGFRDQTVGPIAAEVSIRASNAIEDALRRLYAEGADDPLAVDQLDQIVAISRRKDLGDSERIAEIARLAGALR
jgi:hypothetical protein